MTIFLKILMKLIDEKLSETSKSLKEKSSKYGYNNQLSLNLHMQVEALIENVGNLQCTGDDERNLKCITDLLDKHRSVIKGIREEHQKPGVDGETMKNIVSLATHAKEAFNKLSDFAFKLLNQNYDYETPEGVIYYHAALYLIKSVFEDQPQKDPVRNKKEEALSNRLAILSKLLMQDTEFDHKLKHAKQFLSDLRGDNTSIASNGKSALSNVKFSLFYVLEFSGNAGNWIDTHTSTLVENLNMIETKLKSLAKTHETSHEKDTAPTV